MLGRKLVMCGSDESLPTIQRIEEVYEAIQERRFRPWHAGDLLSVAHTAEDRRAAVQKIVDLVASGAEGRRMVVVVPELPDGKSQRARERAVARRRRAGQLSA
jgi:hypothetical protein